MGSVAGSCQILQEGHGPRVRIRRRRRLLPRSRAFRGLLRPATACYGLLRPSTAA